MIIKRHLPANCHPGRPFISVDGQVVHFISDRLQHPDDPFNVDRIIQILIDYGFSYHLLIPREGDPIELLPPHMEAWHAGRSRMGDRDGCNYYTHGVALVGGTGWEYTESQILHLAQWTAQDMGRNRYTTDEIKGHDQVRKAWNAAHPDDRDAVKVDPGELFPWGPFFDMLGGVDLAVRMGRDT